MLRASVCRVFGQVWIMTADHANQQKSEELHKISKSKVSADLLFVRVNYNLRNIMCRDGNHLLQKEMHFVPFLPLSENYCAVVVKQKKLF